MVWYPLLDIGPRDLPRTIDLVTCPLLVISGGDYWRPHQIVHLGTYSQQQRHLMVATEIEASTVSKRVVCILLECCFFTFNEHWYDEVFVLIPAVDPPLPSVIGTQHHHDVIITRAVDHIQDLPNLTVDIKRHLTTLDQIRIHGEVVPDQLKQNVVITH